MKSLVFFWLCATHQCSNKKRSNLLILRCSFSLKKIHQNTIYSAIILPFEDRNMNVSNNSSAETLSCEISKQISSTITLWVLLFVEVKLTLSSIFMNTVLLVLIARKSTLHLNLRILLIQLSFCLIWSSSGFLMRALYNLILMGTNPCRLVINSFTCKLEELTMAVPVTLVNYSLVIIGIERFYATLRFRTYENNKSILPSLFLMIVLWAGVLCQQLVSLMSMKASMKLMPICNNLLSLTPSTTKTIVILSVTNETLALTVHLINLRINKWKLSTVYINQAQENLTARFQLDQSFKTIRTVLPIVILHTICWTPTGIGMILVFYVKIFNSVIDELSAVHMMNLMTILFGNLYPLITFNRNQVIMEDLRKTYPTLHRIVKVIVFKQDSKIFVTQTDCIDTNAETLKHFEVLQKLFNNLSS